MTIAMFQRYSHLTAPTRTKSFAFSPLTKDPFHIDLAVLFLDFDTHFFFMKGPVQEVVGPKSFDRLNVAAGSRRNIRRYNERLNTLDDNSLNPWRGLMDMQRHLDRMLIGFW